MMCSWLDALHHIKDIAHPAVQLTALLAVVVVATVVIARILIQATQHLIIIRVQGTLERAPALEVEAAGELRNQDGRDLVRVRTIRLLRFGP
jgi:hypothetical protein